MLMILQAAVTPFLDAEPIGSPVGYQANPLLPTPSSSVELEQQICAAPPSMDAPEVHSCWAFWHQCRLSFTALLQP